MSVRISSPSDPAQEVSLAALTVAAVLGMGRLFDDNSWVGPLLLNAIVAHGVVAMLRRRGLTLPVAAAATAAAAGLAVTWSTYWTTTAWGVPTGRTWSAAGDDLRSAWALYGEVVAPAPTATGFVVASVLALWVVAYVADWAAFRLDLPVEALVPAGTLFMFTCLVGAPGGRVGAAALFGSALLAFLLLHRMARQDRASHWVADRGPLGRRSLLGWGVAIGALAVMAGSLVGPTVPGAGSAALLDPRGLGGDGSRVTVSPLIDIRSRLVSQANLEVFTVRSPVHAYWRLTSLDRFDGQIWSSSGTYARARGALSQPETLDAGETFEQTFTIQALSAIWLPAAFQPQVVSTDGVAVRYDEGSSTLIVNNDEPTSDGLVYRVTSVSPRIDVDRLSDDAGAIPADIRERYLPLPDDFSTPVHDLADALTARAAGPAAKARALQDYLRTFDYSLQVQPGHSDSAIEDFLLATKVGYCEQFAGAFAAMARSLGIPARVAVGFTPGQADANDPQLFHVRGEYAHAWPEVYLAGAGWVAYEPTPGRGIPSAEGYTGVPEQQATASDAGGSDLAPTTSEGGAIPSTPSTTAAPGADQATRQDTGQPGAASTTTNLVALTIDPVTRADRRRGAPGLPGAVPAGPRAPARPTPPAGLHAAGPDRAGVARVGGGRGAPRILGAGQPDPPGAGPGAGRHPPWRHGRHQHPRRPARPGRLHPGRR